MGIKAVLFSLLAMFSYIWFRFSGWQFGLGALVALFHDVLSTIGFFSLTQIEFNLKQTLLISLFFFCAKLNLILTFKYSLYLALMRLLVSYKDWRF